MGSEMTITWVAEPEFRLVNEDQMYSTFECVKRGEVELSNGVTVVFELDWRTDVTSTPGWLRGALPQLGPQALLHDRLLEAGMSRHTARKWMLRQLELLPNVSRLRRHIMHAGVWIGDYTLGLFRS